jgi:hypothetical protein
VRYLLACSSEQKNWDSSQKALIMLGSGSVAKSTKGEEEHRLRASFQELVPKFAIHLQTQECAAMCAG